MFDPQEDVEFFSCKCYHMTHIVRFSHFKDDKDWFYVGFAVDGTRGFFKRIYRGVRYIFGFKACCGNSDELVMDKKDALRMRDSLNRYLE